MCTRFLLCCALLWLYIDWFSHIYGNLILGVGHTFVAWNIWIYIHPHAFDQWSYIQCIPIHYIWVNVHKTPSSIINDCFGMGAPRSIKSITPYKRITMAYCQYIRAYNIVTYIQTHLYPCTVKLLFSCILVFFTTISSLKGPWIDLYMYLLACTFTENFCYSSIPCVWHQHTC